MKIERILIAEEDNDLSEMLKLYFDSQGYVALVTSRYDDALPICRTRLPKVVLLDIQLPGIDDLLVSLDGDVRTRYIPLLYLIPEGYPSDGAPKPSFANNHITKPFDVEEIEKRVEAAILRSLRQGLRHPVTNLPTGKFIVEQLNKAKETKDAWVLFLLDIDVVGSADANEAAVYFADIVCELIETHRIQNDFVLGQTLSNEFVMAIRLNIATEVFQAIVQGFREQMEDVARLNVISKPTLLGSDEFTLP